MIYKNRANFMTDELNIRPMDYPDLDAVYDIETRAHIAPWSRGIIHDCIAVGYSCYVLCKEQNIVAFGIARIAAGECHILNLCVKPEEQHRGFGKKLLHFFMNLAQKDCHNIILEVRVSNLSAINLYKNSGFVEIGYRKDYYPGPDNREDAILFSFEIKQP